MPDAAHEDSVQLIGRMARGSRDAFGRFYDRYAALVNGIAIRMLGNRADAEELVQEVFLQLWRKSTQYRRERGSPDAWVVTVTRTRGIDRLRARRRRKDGAAAGDEIVAGASAPGANGLADRVDARLTVEGVLGVIPPEQRKALELAYFGGLTQTEIAEKLAIPLGTVKTRMRLGLRRLRELLGAAAGEGAA